MSNSGCPTHRKGAMKAALAEVEGELEPPRDRKYSSTVIANGPRELVTKLAEKAMRVLEEDLEIGEPLERRMAAQALIAAWTKIDEGEREDPPLTSEQRRSKLLESLRAAMAGTDPVLREALEEAGLIQAESKETER